MLAILFCDFKNTYIASVLDSLVVAYRDYAEVQGLLPSTEYCQSPVEVVADSSPHSGSDSEYCRNLAEVQTQLRSNFCINALPIVQNPAECINSLPVEPATSIQALEISIAVDTAFRPQNSGSTYSTITLSSHVELSAEALSCFTVYHESNPDVAVHTEWTPIRLLTVTPPSSDSMALYLYETPLPTQYWSTIYGYCGMFI